MAHIIAVMDKTDREIIAILRHSGRASVSEIAATLKLARATVRARIDRMLKRGDVLGFTVVLKADTAEQAVRGQMMIEIEGRGTERVIEQLSALASVRAIHTTNGRWDLIVELGAERLEGFDDALRQIRLIEGIAKSETNLLLATRKFARHTNDNPSSA